MSVGDYFCFRRWAVRTSTLVASAYMLILGLGLGMVMQVLVLAVQNAVAYEDLGVATSSAILFRSVGGSVGVSLFGALFASALAQRLATAGKAGAQMISFSSASAIQTLPDAVRVPYLGGSVCRRAPSGFLARCVPRCIGVLSDILPEGNPASNDRALR